MNTIALAALGWLSSPLISMWCANIPHTMKDLSAEMIGPVRQKEEPNKIYHKCIFKNYVFISGAITRWPNVLIEDFFLKVYFTIAFLYILSQLFPPSCNCFTIFFFELFVSMCGVFDQNYKT